MLAAAIVTGGTLWLVLGVAAAGVTYYNVPLLERRPIVGANQYGIFIQGLGLIRWRAIERIDLVEIAVRASTIHELQIALKTRLSSALVADWRQQPFYRSLMRLPWSMARVERRRRQSRAVQPGAGGNPSHSAAAVEALSQLGVHSAC